MLCLALQGALLAATLAIQPRVEVPQAITANPLSFDTALEMAVKANADVLTAAAAVEAARGRALQAGYRPNPELRVSVEGFGGSGAHQGFQSAETTVGVAQTFEMGGKRSARVELAKAELLTAELDLAVARAGVAERIRLAFAEAQAARTRLQLAQEALDRARELSRIARLLVQAGSEATVREVRARSAEADAEAALGLARVEAETSMLSIATLLGASEPPFAIGTLPVPQALAPASGPTLALRRADAALAAANARLALARTGAVPDVTGEVGARHYSENGDKALVASVSMPLPFGNRNQGNIAAARVEANAAEIQRRQVMLATAQEIAAARARLLAAQRQAETLSSRSVPAAREALRLTRIGYQAGKLPLIDVLDAEATLNAALTSLADAELQRQRAIATLIRLNS